MSIVQVVIDDSANKVITGVWLFEGEGKLAIPHGSSFPSSPIAHEFFWRDDEAKLYKRNASNTAWDALVAAVAAHKTTHEPGGSDALAVDAAADTGSLRTLGTGSLQACAGNDGRLSDARTPTAHATSHYSGGSDALAHQSIAGAGSNTHDQIDTHLGSTSNPHSVTKTQVGLGNVTDDAQLKRAAGDFATFAEKGTPGSADLLLIEDSAAAGAKKKVQVGSLPGGSGTDANAIHKNVAAEISTITAKTRAASADLVVIEDSADSNAKKKMTVGDLLRAAIDRVYFFDDFVGANYANRIWAVTGTGSASTVDVLGGVLRVRANSGATYTLDQGNRGAWNAAKGVSIVWRGYCVPGASGIVEIGMMSAPSETTDWIGWRYAPAENANFLCECGDGGVTTTVNSGVAGNGNYHEFRIDITTNKAEFYLDGTLRATITTNVTSDRLQPYVYNQGVGAVADFFADWVEIVGAR